MVEMIRLEGVTPVRKKRIFSKGDRAGVGPPGDATADRKVTSSIEDKRRPGPAIDAGEA